MNCVIILLTLFLPQHHCPSPTPTARHASDNLRKKLDLEADNAFCCQNNLPCCQQPEKSTTFEVKAIVTDCPNTQCTNITSYQKVVVHSGRKPPPPKLTDCHQKLLLSVNMINDGVTSDKSQYIIIDHIVDAVTEKRVRILNPYAVRIRQGPLMEVYPLQFERAVNAEAREEVHNKDTPNFKGCSTDEDNPTCRVVRHEGRVVPYSTGFCCSCDPEKNAMREGQWLQQQVPDFPKSYYKDYGYTKAQAVYDREKAKLADRQSVNQQFRDFGDGKIRQRRGGQSCDDVSLSHLPESFHESAHCLTFSNLWYSVYRLDKPLMAHHLRIQIFQKYEDCHGNTHWMDLTQGRVVEIGTHQRQVVDKAIIASYSPEELDPNGGLDYEAIKLLVPEKRVVNPEEFMVLPKRLVGQDGATCNTAGVGYEAFYKQKRRCARPRGSCLKNQPLHFHQRDKRAEEQGQKGQYFLKFYGTLAEEPISYNSSGHVEYLKMMYTQRHVSHLYFELNADLVTLLKPHSFATITEVYSDATNPQKTRIVVKVTNSGLLYGVFYVRLSNCPMEIPASFNNIASKSVLILPQHQHIFNLYIEYPLPVNEFFCSIHVHNINQELLAVRAVRIQTYDRCICIWHCECACYVADRGLKCTPMTLEAYHEAGFQGGFPFPSKLVESSYLDELLALLLSTFTFLIATLLVMGLIKALLGLCFSVIGMWGLATILGTEQSSHVVCENEECEWKRQHKDEGISVTAQFCLNVIFFIVYPLVLCNIAIKKFCLSKYTMEDSSRFQKMVDYEECHGECVEECEAECRSKKSNTFSMRYTSSEDKGTSVSEARSRASKTPSRSTLESSKASTLPTTEEGSVIEEREEETH